eukprot:SAG22_NODE_520_length_9508_cov_1.914869_5_plen_194_part_00
MTAAWLHTAKLHAMKTSADGVSTQAPGPQAQAQPEPQPQPQPPASTEAEPPSKEKQAPLVAMLPPQLLLRTPPPAPPPTGTAEFVHGVGLLPPPTGTAMGGLAQQCEPALAPPPAPPIYAGRAGAPGMDELSPESDELAKSLHRLRMNQARLGSARERYQAQLAANGLVAGAAEQGGAAAGLHAGSGRLGPRE